MSCSLLFMGCRHDDVLETDTLQNNEVGLKGKSFVLTQSELEARYADNKNLYTILQNEFKTENGLIKANSETDENSVYIDLDHIQVFESREIHAITYKVNIEGISTEPESGRIKEVFNLVYFSTNKIDYYVTLFRYDFSTISFERFVQSPQLTNQLLTFVPLKDIEYIYENIHSSIFNGMANKGGAFTSFTIQHSDCSETTYVAGTECKGSGNPKHSYGEPCGMTGSDRATPGFSYTTYKPCGGGSGGSVGGSVGGPGSGPGSGGGSGGGGSTPTQPIKANPIKSPGYFNDIGGYLAQINNGNTNNNSKILKSLVENNKVALQDLYAKKNYNQEHGYRFSKTKTGDLIKVVAPISLPLVTAYSLGTKILRINHSIIGFVHTHTNPNQKVDDSYAHPMFSHTDIMALFDMVNKNPSIDKNPPDLFTGLMVNGGFYVIMFPNDVTHNNIATKYSNFATMTNNKMAANREAQVWTDMENKLKTYYENIRRNGSNKDIRYEKALLLTLKEFGLNVKVYKMADDGGQFTSPWKALSLPTTTKDPFDTTQPIEALLN